MGLISTQGVKSDRCWGSVNTELSCPFNLPRLIWPSLPSHRPNEHVSRTLTDALKTTLHRKRCDPPATNSISLDRLTTA